jgi:hypothetical protein
MAAVARRKCRADFEVCRPQEVQLKPPLRQAAGTLPAMGDSASYFGKIFDHTKKNLENPKKSAIFANVEKKLDNH